MCFVWLGSANFFVSPMEFNFLTYIDSGNIIAMHILFSVKVGAD